jgi:hypothetical protein
MRFLHLIVVAALVVAAVDVYRIKFESTVLAQRAAKLRVEIRRERDAIAVLRAQWAQLDNPARIQALAQRHLALKPIEPTQIESFDRLPERPASPAAPPPGPPPIDAVAVIGDDTAGDLATGSTGATASAPPAPATPPATPPAKAR